MKLAKRLYVEYFSKKISQDVLYCSLGIGEVGFEQLLSEEFMRAYEQQDSEMVEYLVFTLYLGEDSINLSEYMIMLNKLIVCQWHNRHEDIAILLQKIGLPESVDYLYKAIYLKPKYLEWDDNYAFEKKCIHAIAYCKTQDAREKLKILAENENEVIRICAIKELKKANAL